MDNKQLAQGIASLGRYGDTTLMHMRPEEVSQLQAISRAGGGDITINPDTGMPEAFLGDFFSALAPTAAGLAAGAIFPGAPFLAPALAGGFTAYAQGKRDPLEIGMGALSGYGGGQLGSTLRGFGATQGAAQGSAEVAGGLEGTTSTVAGEVGKGVGATGGTTAGANAFGQQQFISPFTPQGITGIQPNQFMGTTAAESQFGPLQAYNQTGPYAGTQGMAQTLGKGGFQPNVPLEGGGYTSDFGAQQQAMQNYTGNTSMMQSKKLGSFEQGLDLGKGLAETGKGFEAALNDPTGYFKYAGDGSALMGGVKTALPFAGAGLEAYQKGMYEDIPTYEASTAGRYDPTRRLNLGMDTGLRLLAGGGKVAFEEGGVVRDKSYYGITPQYQTSGASYSPIMGVQGGTQTRVPVMGFVDVGGKFVANPKGTMSDIDYENRFKYVTEGVAKPKDEGGDMTALNAAASGAGGINPAMALQAAQGYASQQQSDLNQQGLGGLRSGGAIKYQQGGKTTAEQNTVKTATPPPVTTMDLMLAKKNQEDVNQQGLPAGLNLQSLQAAQEQQGGMAGGGIAELTPENGTMLSGDGDGVSDDIAANIEGEQEAALSDGEFIVPARIVSELGNGSSDAGAKKLYEMIDRIQAARSQTMGNKKEYAKDTNAERYLPA